VITESLYQLGLAFFGLSLNNIAEFRLGLFTQIHEIVFHGQGGYDWNTVYNMPIWLRKFTFSKMDDFYKKNSQQANDLAEQTNQIKSGKISIDPKFQNQKNRIPKY
jgi:hypothetical protein